MQLNGSGYKMISCALVVLALTTSISRAQENGSTEGGLAAEVLQSAREHKARVVYNNLTPEIMDSTPDNKLSQVIQDYVRAKMNWTLSNEVEVLARQPEVIRNIYLVSQVQAEVNQGGFIQLFKGSAARLADSAIAAFHAIKAPQTASVLKKALEINKEKGTEEQIQAQDEAFFNLFDKENLNKLQVQYIKKHKKLFLTQ